MPRLPISLALAYLNENSWNVKLLCLSSCGEMPLVVKISKHMFAISKGLQCLCRTRYRSKREPVSKFLAFLGADTLAISIISASAFGVTHFRATCDSIYLRLNETIVGTRP